MTAKVASAFDHVKAAVSNTAAATTSDSAVDKLKTSLSPTAEVVTPNSENYAASIRRWSSSAERAAAIIVFPTSASDVSKAVKLSTTHKLELAVKGGGHATSGSSSTSGGLCVDLSKMRTVTVDAEAKTITAEGGALWSDVDTEAERYGFAGVGGTVNHTGIGGLTLGGGYGYLTGKVGLVIDNLLEVELVLADGSIVTASEKENADLFWALRGAGSAFGVAIKFVYKAHEQKGPVWGGMLIFPPTLLGKVVEMANTVLEEGNGDKAMLVGFGAPPPAFQPVVIAVVFYDGPEEEAKKFYEPLLSLGPLANMTSTMPYSGANAMLNAAMEPGFRRSMKGSAFLAPLTLSFADSIFADFEAFIKDLPDAGMTAILFEFVPFHKLLSVPQDATAFANRGAYGNIAFAPGWHDAANDEKVREWTRLMAQKARKDLESRIKAEAKDENTQGAVGEYGNYDSLDEASTTLFGKNAPRLAELKRKYDPGNVFCKGPRLLD